MHGLLVGFLVAVIFGILYFGPFNLWGLVAVRAHDRGQPRGRLARSSRSELAVFAAESG
jgi:hypothetical protein